MYYNAKIILSCIHPSNSQTHKPQVKLIQITYLLMFPDRASCPHWPSRRLMAGINICVEDDISPAFHGLECTSATTLLFICHMWIRLWLIWKTNAMNFCAACLFLRQMTFLMKCCRAVRRINLNISCFCLGYNSVIICNNVKKKFSRLPLIHTLPPKQHSKRQVMLLIFQHHPIQVSP